MTSRPRQIQCTIPILPVADLQKSIQFFTDTLGFSLDWGGGQNDTICSVSRDQCPIMLSQQIEAPSPAWVWIGLEDDSLFELYKAKGVPVHQERRNCSWAYEMKFKDIDGNILWLGTEPKKDLPFEDKSEG
jgi:predicted lactoylglutathione lyase